MPDGPRIPTPDTPGWRGDLRRKAAASGPRILTPADRAAIRERWDDGDLASEPWVPIRGADVLGLLDTCDAMENVIRRLDADWFPSPHAANSWESARLNQTEWEPMTPAEAAVLDTIREHGDG